MVRVRGQNEGCVGSKGEIYGEIEADCYSNIDSGNESDSGSDRQSCSESEEDDELSHTVFL